MPAAELRAHLANDLEPGALRAVPELARWRRLLDGAGLEHFTLSGSGSSFFGVFAAEGEARAACARAQERARAVELALRLSRAVRGTGRGILPQQAN